MYKSLVIAPDAFPHTRADVTVNALSDRGGLGRETLNAYATVCVYTGACHVQIYLTSDDLRAVSLAMLDAAATIDERQQEATA